MAPRDTLPFLGWTHEPFSLIQVHGCYSQVAPLVNLADEIPFDVNVLSVLFWGDDRCYRDSMVQAVARQSIQRYML